MFFLAPMWNENSQVYQLDFGGRVTQESGKKEQFIQLNLVHKVKIFMIIFQPKISKSSFEGNK